MYLFLENDDNFERIRVSENDFNEIWKGINENVLVFQLINFVAKL